MATIEDRNNGAQGDLNALRDTAAMVHPNVAALDACFAELMARLATLKDGVATVTTATPLVVSKAKRALINSTNSYRERTAQSKRQCIRISACENAGGAMVQVLSTALGNEEMAKRIAYTAMRHRVTTGCLSGPQNRTLCKIMGVQAAEADPTTVAHSNPCEVELLEGDTRPALRVPHVHNAKRDPVKAADLVLQAIKEEIPEISAPLAATMGVAMKHHRRFLLELWKTENALAQSQDVELFMLGSMVQHQKNGRPFGEAEEEEDEDTAAGDNTLESEDSDDPDYEHEPVAGGAETDGEEEE
jgi:hypothetical protein